RDIDARLIEALRQDAAQTQRRIQRNGARHRLELELTLRERDRNPSMRLVTVERRAVVRELAASERLAECSYERRRRILARNIEHDELHDRVEQTEVPRELFDETRRKLALRRVLCRVGREQRKPPIAVQVHAFSARATLDRRPQLRAADA